MPAKHEKCREIPRDLDLTAFQGRPRSSIVVSMESPYVTYYYKSLIVTLAVSATVARYSGLKIKKLLILPTSSLFDAPVASPWQDRPPGILFQHRYALPSFLHPRSIAI